VASRALRWTGFVVIMFLQFGIFEVALRTWGSSEAAPAFQGLFTADPEIGYRLKPGARVRFTTAEFDTEIAINRAGVRDDEEIGPKAPNERRIVILGDSLVLSVQVPFRQTFGEILETRLNSRPSLYRYRVINAGVQGYGPIEERLFFHDVARELDPDVVLETLFVGNDAEEAVTSEPRLGGGAQPTAAARMNAAARLRRTGVLLMPARFQVDDGDYGRLRDAVAQAGGELVRDGATERFDRAVAALPLPRLDLLPPLRTARPGPDLFFQQTVHLTPRGHVVIADAIAAFLSSRGLLDTPR